jgi:hypothetical protein
MWRELARDLLHHRDASGVDAIVIRHEDAGGRPVGDLAGRIHQSINTYLIFGWYYGDKREQI